MTHTGLKWVCAVVLAAGLAACGGGSSGTPDAGPKCTSALLECDGTCIDPQTDAANCGACGTACGTGTACVAGSCEATCGDGVKADVEDCDDGNTVADDGCSATCTVETGWACQGSPSECTTGCGDGVTAGMEVCDDGNTTDGDGCSAACEVEDGFDCSGTPSTCQTTCGDGVTAGTEACDDGNTTAGDGCSDTCVIESGYTCTGAPSTCATVCGDSVTAGSEACDDGNATAGDGCSDTCAIESGYTCTGAPSICETTCGDGVTAGKEACDDGNATAADGCSDTCAVEEGYSCSGAPSICATECGDGVTAGKEACDDGNATAADGCSDTCAIEDGYTCAGAPSTCETTCGDGVSAGTETCDDGNTTAGDGCDATCAIESGYSCSGTPSTCATTCGDGTIAGNETCDDGNATAGDGCDATCAIESGYSCTGAPSTCSTTCGDAVAAGIETCDDGNTTAGDGCDATCATESGYSCTGSPSTCATVCGDGIVIGSEACDDGNTSSADGCDSSCAIESGFSCTGAPSTCATVCGDGILAGAESCDDGNATSGDGCSDTCALEPGYSCSGTPTVCTARMTCPAGSSFMAFSSTDLPLAFDDTTPADSIISVTGPGVVTQVGVGVNVAHTWDEDVDLSLVAPSGNSVDLTSDNGDSDNDYIDTWFVDSASTAITDGTAPFTGDFRPEQALSTLNGIEISGNWTLHAVDDAAYIDGTLQRFDLMLCVCTNCEIGETYCNDGIDNDGNSQVDCADPSCSNTAACAVCGDGVTAPSEACDDGNNSVGDGCDTTCAAEPGYSCTGSPSTCAAVCGDGVLIGSEGCDDGNSDNGDGCDATCATESGFTCSGAPSTCSTTCGDGILAGGESCEDGNTTNGDGCSGTCVVEAGYSCTGSPSTCSARMTCPSGSTFMAYSSTDLPQAFDDTTPADSIISVTGTGLVSQIGVGVNVAHHWDEDVDLSLVAPTGDSIDLSSDNGADNYDYTNTWFFDSASTAITAGTAPFTGDFRPEQALSTLNGTGVNGSWTLHAVDDESGINGTLQSFDLMLCVCTNCEVGETLCGDGIDNDGNGQADCADPACGNTAACAVCGDGVVAPGEACDDGNVASGDGCSSTCQPELGYTCSGAPGPCTPLLACPMGSTYHVYTASDLPQTVDSTTPTAVSTITVADPGTVALAAVKLNITHSYDGDLEIRLGSPGGTSVDLSIGNGGWGDEDFIDTLFIDSATTAIGNGYAPYTGAYQPDSPLSAVNGDTSNGDWTLTVDDTYPSSDDGVVNDFMLMLCE